MLYQDSRQSVSRNSVDISVILPCYRHGKSAIESAETVAQRLSASPYSWEIIVVDDGAHDVAPIWQWPSDSTRFKLVELKQNQGKGGAVKAGIEQACGKVRIFTDADLPFELEHFESIARLILDRGFHVVIGDRTLPTSSYGLKLSWTRRLTSSVFTAIVGHIVTGGLFDTQCGLKAFRGDVAEELFRIAQVKRFAFDVELVYLCLIHKLDLKRIPVRLRRNNTSSMNIVSDSLRMFFDLLRIKRNSLVGLYDSPHLRNLVCEEYADLVKESTDIRTARV